jgi:hypothetical protein
MEATDDIGRVDMHTNLQLTPAQRRIRESLGKRSSDTARIAQHRIQLPRVHESLVRVPDRPLP